MRTERLPKVLTSSLHLHSANVHEPDDETQIVPLDAQSHLGTICELSVLLG